jgi:hypothetical protein
MTGEALDVPLCLHHALDAAPYAKRACSATVSDVWVDLGKVSTIE